MALDATGRPSLQALQHRLTAGVALAYYAFDLSSVNLPNSTGRSRWGEGITVEDMLALRWLKPTQVVEVEFVE